MKEIDVLEHASTILTNLSNGALLTTKCEGKENSMVISWGMLGIEWGRAIFTVFVREHRFTKEAIEKSGVFSINIPMEKLSKEMIQVFGTMSGHQVEKSKELDLHRVEGHRIDVSAIKEVPITIECKLLYHQLQNSAEINEELTTKFYPHDVDSCFHGANKDYHIAYYGEILSLYILEE